jgi:hypothetical protein
MEIVGSGPFRSINRPRMADYTSGGPDNIVAGSENLSNRLAFISIWKWTYS